MSGAAVCAPTLVAQSVISSAANALIARGDFIAAPVRPAVSIAGVPPEATRRVVSSDIVMRPTFPSLSVRVQRWPIPGAFTLHRGAKTEAAVVVAELSVGVHRGRGECVPYTRYGEAVEGVAAAIEALGQAIAQGFDRTQLQSAMPPGAARNALDCAF